MTFGVVEVFQIIFLILILLFIIAIVIMYLATIKFKDARHILNIELAALSMLAAAQIFLIIFIALQYYEFNDQKTACEERQHDALQRAHCPQGVSQIRLDKNSICQTFY
jgi:hypothetical protein